MSNTLALLDHFPLVSIIVPCYNSEKFIVDSISSLVSQTYPNFEIIVFDDASVDLSLIILEENFGHIPFVRIYNRTNNRSPGFNQGVASTLNDLIELASGEYIMRHDADDISHPHRISLLPDSLLKNKADACFSYINLIPGHSRTLSSPISHESISSSLFFDCSLFHPSVLYKTSSLFKISPRPYSEKFVGFPEDYDLWFKFLAFGFKLYTHPEPLYSYRLHDGQVTYTRKRQLIDNSLALQLRNTYSLLSIDTNVPFLFAFGSSIKRLKPKTKFIIQHFKKYRFHKPSLFFHDSILFACFVAIIPCGVFYIPLILALLIKRYSLALVNDFNKFSVLLFSI